jgi:tRNA-Thr(GGU) m(6)t(6)A37 methyltransferase TsaA
MSNASTQEGITVAQSPLSFKVNPIGVVRNSQVDPVYIHWGELISQIIIDPQHVASLEGLQDYSHLMIIFWMDQVCFSKTTHVPQGKHETVPEVGMFACRCPHRPNPIGVTLVPILDIEGNTLTVQGLDAVDRTPVIDLKPYTPQYDIVGRNDATLKSNLHKSIRVPEWVYNLTY